MSTATGFATFDQVSVHYSGPQFRVFGFNFSLKPTSFADQAAIGTIVDFFKQAAAPELIHSNFMRSYEIPYFFEIKFYGPGGREMTSINKIAKCVLTSFEVKYGGDRFQTFAISDAPVQTDITMSFKEVELLTKKEMAAGY